MEIKFLGDKKIPILMEVDLYKKEIINRSNQMRWFRSLIM